MPHIFSVWELTQSIKNTLEGEFPVVWVQGQVGNVSRPGSGHIYFTLKDDRSSLDVVWFNSNQRRGLGLDPAKLSTGQDVLCAGRLSVYAQRGTYQVLAEMVQEQGLGRLHLQFEALKRSLSAEGLFDPARKRPLPGRPRRVAVITSPTGAALMDFVRISHHRGLPGEMRIYPCQVQGQDAEETVAGALEMAGLEGWAEIAVLIRGGGSLEDLWTFNTETVARGIAACAIPVLTGIGHEVDTTIADLVADHRAATPSHAAQVLWPERRRYLQDIDTLETRLLSGWSTRLDGKRQQVEAAQRALGWLSPKRHLLRLEERLHTLSTALNRLGGRWPKEQQESLHAALRSLLRTRGATRWEQDLERVEALAFRLRTQTRSWLHTKEHVLQHLQTSLHGQDPYRPLRRGYSLVRVGPEGVILRRADQAQPGDLLHITAHRARVRARVEEVDEPEAPAEPAKSPENETDRPW